MKLSQYARAQSVYHRQEVWLLSVQELSVLGYSVCGSFWKVFPSLIQTSGLRRMVWFRTLVPMVGYHFLTCRSGRRFWQDVADFRGPTSQAWETGGAESFREEGNWKSTPAGSAVEMSRSLGLLSSI